MLFFALTLALSGTADAAITLGNPSVIITTAGPDDVLLWSLELEHCTGGIESLPLREWVDANSGLSMTLPQGDYCEITAILHGPPNAAGITTAAGEELDIFTPTSSEAEIELDEAGGVINLIQLQ